jgi:cell division protein FtsI (penicillin-binding protein 3)
MIDCRNGFIEVAGHRFNDPHATKVMSYGEALAVSSNVAAIKTGLSLGKEKFYAYAQKFGIGQQTGIELPGEVRGQFRSPQTWNGDSLASMSIGYEVGVTALQMASVYGTIANDGVKVKPHVIKEIRHADGKIFSQTEPEKTQIVSVETARGLKQMLRQVVVKGTARRAQLNGYTSSGKTGTAWKYNAKLKRVDAGKYVSSFIGLAPADNPTVVIAVVMDEPQGGARDGGQVSAPVFREIAEAILPEMNIAPDANLPQEVLTAQNVPKEVEAETISTETEVADAIAQNATQQAEVIDETKKTDSPVSAKKLSETDKPKETKKTTDIKKEAEKQIAKETKVKEIKKETKPPNEEKDLPKQKTAVLNTAKPKTDAKNKSSTERSKQKT